MFSLPKAEKLTFTGVYEPGVPNDPEHMYRGVGQKSMPSRRTTQPMVTGTSVLGIRFNGGVVIAADTLGSYGSSARFRSVERVRRVGEWTMIGGGGDYSDFQYIHDLLEEYTLEDKLYDDGSEKHPSEIYNLMTRIMYQRRNKMSPLWNQLVVSGFCEGKGFLGLVDLHGTSYEDTTIATGYGDYIARPLLRKAYRDDLTQEEAIKAVEDAMRVMFYRDARTINKIQFAVATAEGITISEPKELDTTWVYDDDRTGVLVDCSQ
mmetsp:Transcript_23694/g.59303  ORF Transcript_23694/g.59303 Transcript_23694/m.59303 type:complete len:263 (+) Transcript_23694:108-896(+)|eukprot:CAMPEP_0177648720 /NCGR_PEP_ID=MMETSP0447-20121125/10978_1 /TAXON_ID=0 /ORGANISM="Stygamoeba regulata, Strain BSH-02190019" /LENGTH=262 /DNA_ID=CAMNT_0019151379 /DNA_START=94 /DNA_END=882 /DNA_ORIENTATION=+